MVELGVDKSWSSISGSDVSGEANERLDSGVDPAVSGDMAELSLSSRRINFRNGTSVGACSLGGASIAGGGLLRAMLPEVLAH